MKKFLSNHVVILVLVVAIGILLGKFIDNPVVLAAAQITKSVSSQLIFFLVPLIVLAFVASAVTSLKSNATCLFLFAFLFWAGLNVSINDFPKEILEEKPMYRIMEIILAIVIFLISLLPLITSLIYIIKHIIVKLLGKEIEGIVYGYTDNTSTIINGNNTKAIKILIDTPEGKKFILYKTEDTKKKYKLNSKIKLLVYKKLFLIKNKKEFLFE